MYNVLVIITEMLVTPYVGLEKFLMFFFLSVCEAIAVAEIIRFAWNLAQMFKRTRNKCLSEQGTNSICEVVSMILYFNFFLR